MEASGYEQEIKKKKSNLSVYICWSLVGCDLEAAG